MTDTPEQKPTTPAIVDPSESEIVQFFVAIWRFVQGLAIDTCAFVRRFLEEQRPSIIFFTAFIVLILSAAVAQLAIYAMPGMEDIQRNAANGQSWMQTQYVGSARAFALISATSYYMKIAALMLAVWALIRLIADAIKDGAKS